MLRTEPGAYWGPFIYKPQHFTRHFLVAGATGSGKTVLIKRLLKSVLADEGGARRRALVYDPKQEFLSVLYAMNLGNRIRVLHPFDRRAAAWDIAQDIDNPLSARQLATILIPSSHDGNDTNSFFTDAVRDLLSGVLLAFINCVPKEKSWTFRDIILCMLYTPYLEFILSLEKTRQKKPFPVVSRLRETYLQAEDKKTLANIRATINTRLSIFEPIAAAWHKAWKEERRFSLRSWLAEGSHDILVLGNDEAARASLDAVNAALFKRATELILSRKEQTEEKETTGDETTWIFLDEVREAGKLDGLSRLLTKGRSKGACVVLGFQDIDGLKDVYGDDLAYEIVGQCNNVAVLKMNSPSSAKWGAELFGEYLAEEENVGRGVSSDGLNASVTRVRQERAALYTQELICLPRTSPQNGLTGFFRDGNTRQGDTIRFELQWEKHIQETLPPKGTEEDSFVSIDNDDMYLQPWDRADWKRLGFRGTPPSFSKPRVRDLLREMSNDK